MKYEHFQTINKSEIQRVRELYYSLRIIFDANNLIYDGKFYNISVIYGQLRSLLTEKSKTNTPLLFKVAEILKEDLEFYYLPEISDADQKAFEEGMIFSISSASPSIEKTLPKQVKVCMEEFLTENIITYKDRKFDVRKVIEELANKYGGSHYSQTTHRYLSELLSLEHNNQPILNNLIIQISDLVRQLGIRLLKKITDLEIYLDIILTENPDNTEVFIFDYQLPSQKNRFSLFIKQNNLHFLIIDNVGYKTVITIDKLIDYNKMILVNVSLRLNKEFKTEVKIYIEEKLQKELIIEDPQLLINDIRRYKCSYNKAVDSKPQNYEFGLGAFVAYGKELDQEEKLQRYHYLKTKKTEQIAWFNKASSGYSDTNEGDIKMSGNVTIVDRP